MVYTNVFRGIAERGGYFLSFYVGEGEGEALSVEGSYMPSSSVSVFGGGGGGGGERGVQLKSDSYILYYIYTGNSFTAIL